MTKQNTYQSECADGEVFHKVNIETSRLKCIDILRGMTIAIMLICDNPGNPQRIYPQLRHAEWNGCTIADLAFPFFIVIMGMVVPCSIERRIKSGKSSLNIFLHILFRSIGLFILGLFLNGFPLYNFSIIRIPGVLQRIAVDYFIISVISLVLKITIKNITTQILIQLVASLMIITSYYFILKFIHVPTYGKGTFDANGNLVQYIDLYFLKDHLYRPNWDPEGILSTVPSMASALLGGVIGQLLFFVSNSKIKKIIYMFTLGTSLLILSFITNMWFPFNKNLWSSSLVLLTAGLACILVLVLYILTDLIKFQSVFKPFMILGSNAIFVYVISEIVRKTLWLIPVTDSINNTTVSLNVWITTHLFTPWAGNALDSLYFSIFYMVIWIIIMTNQSALSNRK